MADLPIQQCAMRRILILLLAIMPTIASAQGFQIEDGQVTWRKIYTADLTISDIHKAMVISDDYYDITVLSDCVVAKTKPVKYVPEDYGFKWGNSHTTLLNGALGPITLRIDVKEGRYRVTAYNMIITDITPTGLLPAGTQTRIENIGLDDDSPNKTMTTQLAPIFDHLLNHLTSFQKVDDDW